MKRDADEKELLESVGRGEWKLHLPLRFRVALPQAPGQGDYADAE
jgi:hypothetical protein